MFARRDDNSNSNKSYYQISPCSARLWRLNQFARLNSIGIRSGRLKLLLRSQSRKDGDADWHLRRPTSVIRAGLLNTGQLILEPAARNPQRRPLIALAEQQALALIYRLIDESSCLPLCAGRGSIVQRQAWRATAVRASIPTGRPAEGVLEASYLATLSNELSAFLRPTDRRHNVFAGLFAAVALAATARQ